MFEDLSTPIEPAYIYYVCGVKIMTALKLKRRDKKEMKHSVPYTFEYDQYHVGNKAIFPPESTIVCCIQLLG